MIAHALAVRTPYLSSMTTVQTEPATGSVLTLGGRSFRSRLMVGTGKYRNNA